MAETRPRSVDPAALHMIEVAKGMKAELIFDRFDAMQPGCKFGVQGICCRICTMGPCRITARTPHGICGADENVIAARNLVRMIAAGASAHSDHGRDIANTLKAAAEGRGDYRIKDERKLRALAREFSIPEEGRSKEEVAKELATRALQDFGNQEGELLFMQRALEPQKKLWRDAGVMPRGIDREVVEIMHRTTMGVDNDYKNIIKQGIRSALADGWGGSMIATEIEDVLFGTPTPIRSRVNLGVLDKEKVNILVHGHEPVLSEMIVAATQDPELIEYAKKKGAKGINLAGICCTANEILMRHGVPVAGNFLHQELAIATGVVDGMIVDVQCVMPALGNFVKNFHTKLISTSPKAKSSLAEHMEFHEEHALAIAKKIVRAAIDNFPNRKGKADIPEVSNEMVAGFTAESIFDFLGGRFRSTYRPLNDAIISGRLRGAAAIVGCNTPKVCQDFGHTEMAKELLRHDVLIVTTGCAALAGAKIGLMTPEGADEYAGEGVREICNAVGIPPMIHLGACVDISRILTIGCNIVREGGLGSSIADLPIAGAAPEWMSEKAVAIGFYVIATGVYTVLSPGLPIEGGRELTKYVTGDIEKEFGGKFAFESDPVKAAQLMIAHIDRQREKLKLPPAKYKPRAAGKVAAGAR